MAKTLLGASMTAIDDAATAAVDKHGHLNTPLNSKSDALVNLSILLEEVGEVAHALNEKDPENLKEELAQVGAVCAMWLDGIAVAEYEAKQANGLGYALADYDPCFCDAYGTCVPCLDRDTPW